MSIILCTGVTFVKKNSCLVARIILFDTEGLHLFTFCILELHSSKDIELGLSINKTLSYINDFTIVPYN